MPTKRDKKDPFDTAPEASSPASGAEGTGSSAERRKRISVAAYYNAERRGFRDGGDVDDWLEAEREVDGRASEKGPKGEASAGALTHGSQPDTEAAVPPKLTDRPDFPDLEQAGVEHIEPDQVAKWARRLKVPAPKLREAIQRVGPLVSDVKQFLENHAARP
jgi:hypothetical protein